MKKSNCKGRLLGIAGMCIAIATLGFAYASIAVASGWFPFKLPGSGLTNIFMDEKIAALFVPACAFVFTLVDAVALWAASRKKTFPVLLSILLLAGIGFVYAELTYNYYLVHLQTYSIVTAVLTVLVAIAFLLSLVALFVKAPAVAAAQVPAQAEQESCQVEETAQETAPIVVEEAANQVAEAVIEATAQEVATQESTDEPAQELAQCDEPCQQPSPVVQEEAQPSEATQRQLARLKTLLDKGVINQSQYEKLVDQFTNNK